MVLTSRSRLIIYYCLNGIIASVWLINGLFCKLMDMVPRHRMIVARVLQADNAVFFTRIIGFTEVLMALWIVSGVRPRLAAGLQVLVILLMNIIEFMLASDLLLWGRLNIIFAFGLAALIYWNGFILKDKKLRSI